MSHFLTIGGACVRPVLLAAFAASVLAAPAAQAQTVSCPLIADQLAHQNTPLEDAAQRLTVCARKHAKYDDSLKSRSKREWQNLCEKDSADAYLRLADNRETILRRCQPRGSTR